MQLLPQRTKEHAADAVARVDHDCAGKSGPIRPLAAWQRTPRRGSRRRRERHRGDSRHFGFGSAASASKYFFSCVGRIVSRPGSARIAPGEPS